MTKKNMQVENEATLSNKRIALLGGSSGIGLAVAQQVVEQGPHPVIASSNAERVQKAVASVNTPEKQRSSLQRRIIELPGTRKLATDERILALFGRVYEVKSYRHRRFNCG